MSAHDSPGDTSGGTTAEASEYRHCPRCECPRQTTSLPRSDRAACVECGLVLDDSGKPESGFLRLVDGCEFSTVGAGQ